MFFILMALMEFFLQKAHNKYIVYDITTKKISNRNFSNILSKYNFIPKVQKLQLISQYFLK